MSRKVFTRCDCVISGCACIFRWFPMNLVSLKMELGTMEIYISKVTTLKTSYHLMLLKYGHVQSQRRHCPRAATSARGATDANENILGTLCDTFVDIRLNTMGHLSFLDSRSASFSCQAMLFCNFESCSAARASVTLASRRPSPSFYPSPPSPQP